MVQAAFAVVVVVSLVVVLQQRLQATPQLSHPLRDQTEPVSSSFRNANKIRVGAHRPIYAVAVGTTAGKRWGIVGFGTEGRRWCYQQTGFWANGASGCTGAFDTNGVAVQSTGGSGRDGRFLELGLASLAVRRVVLFGDDGRSWSATAVRPGSAAFRVYAIERPSTSDEPSMGWTDAQGELHRVAYPDDLPLCPGLAPRTGPAAALPIAGDTTHARVTEVANRHEAELLSRYSATALNVESRNGQVAKPTSSGNVRVVEAGDYLIQLFVPSAALCPSQPQNIDGVPLSFVIGPRPEPKQAYPQLQPRKSV